MPAPSAPGAPASTLAPAVAPAPPSGLELPETPGAFGPLQGVALGQSRDEVAARAPGLLDGTQRTADGTTYSVEFNRDGSVRALLAHFNGDRTEALTLRWGPPKDGGEISAWFLPADASRVVLESSGWRIRIERYLPLSKLIIGDGGKLGGVVAEVLGMDRKTFEARFPRPILHRFPRDVVLEVQLPPTEMSRYSSDLDARFTPSGALVAVELHLKAAHSKEITAVLRAAHGEPKDLKLCARKVGPREIVVGIWQADPVLRYQKARPEVTLWSPHPGTLTARWSLVPTRSDHFTSMTPPG